MKDDGKQPTIALVVSLEQGIPVLSETLTSIDEILQLELAMVNREPDPLQKVQEYRFKKKCEDEEFADFVENLLAQPFLKPDVQEHAVKWFKSRSKIESFQKTEDEASVVIAQYAFQIYATNPGRTDFILTGPKAKVRIRIFELEQNAKTNAA